MTLGVPLGTESDIEVEVPGFQDRGAPGYRE